MIEKRMSAGSWTVVFVLVVALLQVTSRSAMAQPGGPEREAINTRLVELAQGFAVEAESEVVSATLRVVGPSGEVDRQSFGPDDAVIFVSEEGLSDGRYRWEVVYRAEGDAMRPAMLAGGLEQGDLDQSIRHRVDGSFDVSNGVIRHRVVADVEAESGLVSSADRENGLQTRTQAATNHNNGSISASANACFGDALCTAGYFPGEDLEVMDSTGNAFVRFLNENDGTPSIDWRIGSGGDGNFSILGGPFLSEMFELSSGAPAASMILSASGFLGLGTAAPAGELHIQSAVGFSEIRMTPESGDTWRWFNGSSGMWLQDVTTGTTPLKVSSAAPDDRFVVAPTGEIGVGTATPSATVEIEGTAGTSQFLIDERGANANVEVMFNLVCNCAPGFRMQNTVNGEVWFFRHTSAGDFSFDNVGSAGLEARLDPNGNLFIQGSLSQGSSRSLKEEIVPASTANVLEAVNGLSLYEWSYIDQEARHFGPMAEEFSRAFGLGESRARVAPADMAGIALAAVQSLSARNQELEEQLASVLKRLEALEEK